MSCPGTLFLLGSYARRQSRYQHARLTGDPEDSAYLRVLVQVVKVASSVTRDALSSVAFRATCAQSPQDRRCVFGTVAVIQLSLPAEIPGVFCEANSNGFGRASRVLRGLTVRRYTPSLYKRHILISEGRCGADRKYPSATKRCLGQTSRRFPYRSDCFQSPKDTGAHLADQKQPRSEAVRIDCRGSPPALAS